MTRTGTRSSDALADLLRTEGLNLSLPCFVLHASFSDAEWSPHTIVAKPYRAGPFQLRRVRAAKGTFIISLSSNQPTGYSHRWTMVIRYFGIIACRVVGLKLRIGETSRRRLVVGGVIPPIPFLGVGTDRYSIITRTDSNTLQTTEGQASRVQSQRASFELV